MAINSEKVSKNFLKSKKGFGKVLAGNAIGLGLNTYAAASDYKDARNQGKGVVASGVSAFGQFAYGEVLGLKGMLAVGAARAIPKGVVGGIEKIGTIQRQMDSQSRNIPFSNAVFRDNQQIATMRQAGMQMAQRSQYNLQQTLLGNEAAYLK